MVRNEAMLRLAKQSCDPELLYSFFKAMGQPEPDGRVGAALRMNMVRNMCLPDVACEKLQNPSDGKQPICNEPSGELLAGIPRCGKRRRGNQFDETNKPHPPAGRERMGTLSCNPLRSNRVRWDRVDQKGQFPGGFTRSIRRAWPAGISWTAMFVAATMPSFRMMCA